MFAKITEKILEPTKIYVGSKFLLKIKVEDNFAFTKQLKTEDNKNFLTEDNKLILTEWGEKNG